jgi:hypothetical protein
VQLKLFKHLFLILFLNLPLFAQESELLKIDLKDSSGSEPQIIDVELNLSESVSNGIFLNFNPEISPVVRSVKVGTNEMWLINNNQSVENENVISWFSHEQGIVFRYNNFTSGIIQIIIAHDSAKLSNIQSLTIEVYQISFEDQELSIQDAALHSASISLPVDSVDDEE